MASTVGRLTGEAGVCLSTLGPGATNLVTGAGMYYSLSLLLQHPQPHNTTSTTPKSGVGNLGISNQSTSYLISFIYNSLCPIGSHAYDDDHRPKANQKEQARQIPDHRYGIYPHSIGDLSLSSYLRFEYLIYYYLFIR